MLKHKPSAFLVSLILLICSCATYYSKGAPDKIVMRGDRLAQPVEMTDREILKGFDVYSGQFIDWKKGLVAAPPNQDIAYEVFFYMKWKERHSKYDQGNLKLIYSVRYVPGRDGAPGYVYLPGRDDDRYSINISTIIREGDDGKWHQASPAWDALMKRLIASSKP